MPESANYLKDNCSCNGDEIAHPQNIWISMFLSRRTSNSLKYNSGFVYCSIWPKLHYDLSIPFSRNIRLTLYTRGLPPREFCLAAWNHVIIALLTYFYNAYIIEEWEGKKKLEGTTEDNIQSDRSTLLVFL